MLNRDFQRAILQRLAELYPAENSYPERLFPDIPPPALKVNLAYLSEHGLVTLRLYPTSDDPTPMPLSVKITAAGLDFLADDGGLTAILGVITVRLHDDTIRKLLIQRIEEEDGDPDVKAQMIAAVKSMPAEAIKAVGGRAVEVGIAAAPAGLMALRSFIGI